MVYRKVKTPRDAKGSGALKLIERTSQSVFKSRIPPKSNANLRHAHSLTGARQIVRIDAQPWEERVADILRILETHRWQRANAAHATVEKANEAMLAAERKRAEVETFAEELEASNEEMRATAEEMRAANEELRVVTEDLERTNMDLERFVPAAEARIVAPLADLHGWLTELGQRSPKELDRETLAGLERAAGAAAGVGELVDGLVGYWRLVVEGGAFEPFDADRALDRALIHLEEPINAAGAEVTHDPLPRVVGDEDQISSLLERLVDNALVFRGDASPRVHVSAERASEEVADDAEESLGWVFSVEDNGRGIEPEHLPHVFALFHTAHEPAGLGIGLAAVWRIVRRHGGRTWVESEPGRGSTFYFTVPERADG